MVAKSLKTPGEDLGTKGFDGLGKETKSECQGQGEISSPSSPKRKNEGGKDEGVLSILFPRKDNVNTRQMSGIDYINEAYAICMGVLVILTFALGALLNITMFFLFKYTIPRIWYAYRIMAVRGNWSLVVVLMRWANVSLGVSGDKGANQHVNATGPRGWYAAIANPKAYMVMMNHLSWADSFVVAAWIYSHNSAGGDTLWPIWKSFLYIPVGWFAYTTAQVFMGFGTKTDLNTLNERTDNFYQRGFSKFFIFPEGGIFRSLLKEKSHAYARKMGFPLLNHCLLPREKAFYLVGKKLKEETGMKDLYDITLGYTKNSPLHKDPFDVLDLLRMHSKKQTIYLNVRHFPLAEIDFSTEEKTRDYLFKRFQEKDQMMEEFYDGKGPLLGYRSSEERCKDGKKENEEEGLREENSSMIWALIDYICWATLLILTVRGYYYLFMWIGRYLYSLLF